MDLSAWLKSLGLERYERAFRDNAIDAEVLPQLTDEHLRELGLPLGHRLKLLQAIAALTASRTATPRPAPAREPAAERRQLTVMFVDLVGSTALSGRLDPEEMSAVIRGYQAAVAGEVTRFGGYVAKYLGDGVLAYFGWPQAHEDAAERAVRAGLAVVDGLGRVPAPAGGAPLAARVGIATGLVVVGELIGEGAAREEAVVGETPNLAARLQALAEPNTVVIGPNTRRLLGGLFELADLGAHELKGFAAPVPAWRVLGPGAAEGRFEARHVAGLTPLVGREEERALLLERWRRAREGEGQVVLLSGEPGIGKSRLVRALRESLEGAAYTPLYHQCSPYHATSPLHPVIEHLERAAGFARGDIPEARLAKLEALLAQTSNDVGEAAPLLAALLALPTGGRYPPLDLTPPRQKARTLEALLAQLVGLAARQAVLLVLEDAHWADPTTLELFDLTVERVRDLPVLVVVTFRPEFSPRWLGHAHVSLLTLNRLSRREGAALVERVTGGRALPAAAVTQIVAKTEGVPLFVEELTKAVLESGLLREEGDRHILTGPLPPLAIPATLQDSLLARLDRLAPVKEVAQIGAALGREFPYELLAAVAPLREGELRTALGQLCAAELVFCRGEPPSARYSFKHALVQDAAYGTLLKSRRQQLHARIVQVLEARFPETAEAEPELLAHHCTEAGLVEKAVEYWHKAGQRAIARSAMTEAVAQLTKGLGVLQGLPTGRERDRRELDLQVALGVALFSAEGQGASDTGRAYARARELAERLGETTRLMQLLYGQCAHYMTRGQLHTAQEAAGTLLSLAQARGDVTDLAQGHRIAAVRSLAVGEFTAACGHLEQALALRDAYGGRQLAPWYAQDPWAPIPTWLAWGLLAMGYPEQAMARHRDGLTRARALGHRATLAQVLFCGCAFRQLAGDLEGVREQAGALSALAAEQAFPFWLAMATIFEGWALARAGEAQRAMDRIRSGLAAYRATAAEIWVPYFLSLLSEAHKSAGRTTEACQLLDEAQGCAARTGERWYDAELHRLKGEALLALSPERAAEAEACFRQAIAVARNQRAKMWELRATVSVARLWRDQGRRAEARDLLAPVYRWFTEGFDTPDLRDAKALLGELGWTPA